jgi:hypothetical protein
MKFPGAAAYGNAHPHGQKIEAAFRDPASVS